MFVFSPQTPPSALLEIRYMSRHLLHLNLNLKFLKMDFEEEDFTEDIFVLSCDLTLHRTIFTG